jgi:hypothetical protein
VPAPWQTGLSCAVQVGNILGLQITGPLSERLGYRLTMLIALVCLTGFLFIQFFAVNVKMLLAGYLLLGVSRICGKFLPLLTSRRFSVPLGYLPNHVRYLRRRRHACSSSSIPHDLCQLVLGHWANHRVRCATSHGWEHYAMGV